MKIYKQSLIAVKIKGREDLFTFDQDDFGTWIVNWDLDEIEWMKPIKIEVTGIPYSIDIA